MQSASTFLKLDPQETVTDEWEVLDDDGRFTFQDLLAIGIGLLFLVVPGLIMIVLVFVRPARRGYLCLTSWRCLYYERGQGFFHDYHLVRTTGLADIVSIYSVYKEGLGGSRTLWLYLKTQHEDEVSIGISEGNRWLATLPLVGRFFRRNTIGKDALQVAPLLYSLIQERRSDGAVSGTGF